MKNLAPVNSNDDLISFQKVINRFGTFKEMCNNPRRIFSHLDTEGDLMHQNAASGSTDLAVGWSPSTYFAVELVTGILATGRAGYNRRINTNAGTQCAIGHGHMTNKCIIRNIPILSTSTEEFGFVMGLISSNTLILADGVYACYDRTVSANWLLRSRRNGGTVANIDTGIPVATGTGYYLNLEIDEDGLEARLYIDGILRATQNTASSLPAANTNLYQVVQIVKSVGTTSRSIILDAIYFDWIPNYTIVA